MKIVLERMTVTSIVTTAAEAYQDWILMQMQKLLLNLNVQVSSY